MQMMIQKILKCSAHKVKEFSIVKIGEDLANLINSMLCGIIFFIIRNLYTTKIFIYLDKIYIFFIFRDITVTL